MIKMLTGKKNIRAFCGISLILLIALCLTSCSSQSKSNKTYKELSKEDPYNKKYKGHYKVGNQYKIKERIYKPKAVVSYSKTGTASWYGAKNGFHGKKTANGDLYNKNLLTAAHKTLPMPSIVRVTNIENNQSILVMVNDRGPYACDREIDLSERAAQLLKFKHKGTAKVKVQYLSKETDELLDRLKLKKKEGNIAKEGIDNKKCSVNCHVKLLNLKYNKNRKGGVSI